MSNLDEISRSIGGLEAKFEHLDKSVGKLSVSVDRLNAHLERQRGGWLVLSVVGTIAGSFGALVAKLMPLWR